MSSSTNSMFSFLSSSTLGGFGKFYGKDSAFGRIGGVFDASLMALDDAVDHGESEATAFPYGLGGKEWGKDVLCLSLGYSRPLIGNLQDDPVHTLPHLHRDAALWRGEIDCVHDQIEKNLGQLDLVHAKYDLRAVHQQLAGNLVLPQGGLHQVDGILDYRYNVHQGPFLGHFTGKEHQFFDHLPGEYGIGDDLVQVLHGLWVPFHPFPEEFRKSQDVRQGGVELMGDTGGDLPQDPQTVRLFHLPSDPFLVFLDLL